MIPVPVLFALLSGCALVDRAADLTSRAFTGVAGRETTPVGGPLSLHLQLALLSDRVVTRIVQETEETPLDAADDPNRRAALSRLRLDYASAMWNAASDPNPYANGIHMLLTLTVGRRRLERSSSVAHALGESLRPTLAVLGDAERDVERLVRNFLTPAELSALDQVIRETQESQVEGQWLGIVDLPELSSSRLGRSGGERGSTNLFSILGLDPFAGLDPATREIAESRQFGERLLFNVQRMPILLRLNAELLATQVAADPGLDRAQASLDRATTAMEQVAETAAGLPDRLSAERARIVADVRAEADRLGALARDYRGLFDAATTMAGTADQALKTFAGVMQRFEPENGQPAAPPRLFEITEYAETANRISEAAVNLSGLMSRVQDTLDSPSATRLTPEVDALLAGAEVRARCWLYTAFALGRGLIVCAGLAVIATVWVLRALRRQPAPGTGGA